MASFTQYGMCRPRTPRQRPLAYGDFLRQEREGTRGSSPGAGKRSVNGSLNIIAKHLSHQEGALEWGDTAASSSLPSSLVGGAGRRTGGSYSPERKGETPPPARKPVEGLLRRRACLRELLEEANGCRRGGEGISASLAMKSQVPVQQE